MSRRLRSGFRNNTEFAVPPPEHPEIIVRGGDHEHVPGIAGDYANGVRLGYGTMRLQDIFVTMVIVNVRGPLEARGVCDVVDARDLDADEDRARYGGLGFHDNSLWATVAP
jgi:hypothetical protein